jgi:hypothetical protein
MARVLQAFYSRVSAGSVTVCAASLASHLGGTWTDKTNEQLDDPLSSSDYWADDPGFVYLPAKLDVMRLVDGRLLTGDAVALGYCLCPGGRGHPYGRSRRQRHPGRGSPWRHPRKNGETGRAGLDRRLIAPSKPVTQSGPTQWSTAVPGPRWGNRRLTDDVAIKTVGGIDWTDAPSSLRLDVRLPYRSRCGDGGLEHAPTTRPRSSGDRALVS